VRFRIFLPLGFVSDRHILLRIFYTKPSSICQFIQHIQQFVAENCCIKQIPAVLNFLINCALIQANN